MHKYVVNRVILPNANVTLTGQKMDPNPFSVFPCENWKTFNSTVGSHLNYFPNILASQKDKL